MAQQQGQTPQQAQRQAQVQPQPQPGQAAQPAQQAQGQSPEQVQAAQQNQQGVQLAAQLGTEIQRSGLSVGTFVQVVAILQRHGPQLVALFTDLQALFGGGAPASGGTPEGQAAPR